MIEIELSKGQRALVDDADFTWLSQWSWHFTGGYARRTACWHGQKHTLFMHRELLRAGPDQLVDHINGNRLDNQRANLRIVSPTINSRNRLMRGGYRGVFFKQDKNRYEAYITVQGKRVYLGLFKTAEEAFRRRQAGEKEFWGYTVEELKCSQG